MNALVVGGNSGIGLSLVTELLNYKYEKIYVVGKNTIELTSIPQDIRKHFVEKTEFHSFDLTFDDYSVFEKFENVNTLIITAGFGRVCGFDSLREKEIDNLIKVNLLAVIRIIKKFYKQISSSEDFYCAVMCSIAGYITSPLFSVYGSAKAGVRSFIENINVELECKEHKNRILDVSPGAIQGTSFDGKKTDLEKLHKLAGEILEKMFSRERKYIPDYEKTYQRIIEKNNETPHAFGIESYNYKMASGRVNEKPQLVIGYLSGTFDLFHIGHLNLIKKAKEQCDLLIVGVHANGKHKGIETFIPFEERKAIVEACKYVDRAVESFAEDTEAILKFNCNKIFVGSDYKGSARFEKYEKICKEKKVEIVYFPYTKSISSSKLRNDIKNKLDLK